MAPLKLMIVGALALGGLGALGFAFGDSMNSLRADLSGAKATRPTMQKLGYLTPSTLPNSMNLLSPPPTPGSAALQNDMKAREAALRLKATPRYAIAVADAARDQVHTVKSFECALGASITQQLTPTLYKLLARVRVDVNAASSAAKIGYRRTRPFVYHETRTCYPADEEITLVDGSYPSARGAVGWAYAQILSQLVPSRAELILARGREFSRSRIICDQEWQSDIDAGHSLATVTVGRLSENEQFKADMEDARREIAATIAAGIEPESNCEMERASLASR